MIPTSPLLEVSETTIPFGLLRLAEQLMPCSAPVNALARLRPFANIVFTAPFKSLRNTSHFIRSHLSPSVPLSSRTIKFVTNVEP
ncbi:hypothetical protein BHE74_00016835 [Ensete ventricosum]|nr:hypothetical protein BHE74_00016835 [Ensete ventricosum]